jgi:hypothetical protein
MVTITLADDAATARVGLDAYCRANYGLPVETVETIQAMTAGTPGQVAAWLARYIEAGARHIVCRIAALSLNAHVAQQEQIADLANGLR